MSSNVRFQVEYALSNRATCKGCDNGIKKDQLRIGKDVKSERHDGWDTSWYHYKCAPYFAHLTDLQNWELLRWEDQIKIKKDKKEKIVDNDEEREREKENKQIWELKDKLEENVPNKILKTMLEANGMEVKKMTPARLLHKCADGMLFGVISNCPVCGNEGTLRWNGITFRCVGWVSGFTRCEFTGTEGITRYKWIIPKELKEENSFLAKWKPPTGHPTAEKKSQEQLKEEQQKQKLEEEENKFTDKEEETVPDGMEMYGIVAMVIGSESELGMSSDKFMEYIESHGGETDIEMQDDTTCLIAAESEMKRKKKNKLVTAFIKAKKPILSPDFVRNLCERKEEGIKLRDPEVAKKYLIGGSFGDTFAKKYFKERADREKAEKEEEEKKARAEEERVKSLKRKRAQPKSGSDILKVDPTFSKAPSAEVVVTHDEDYGYTPYHVMLNQTNISNGVNKYYRMQVLKIKNKRKWYFWIHWGRVGVDEIGGFREYEKGSENSAIEAFVNKFQELTENTWEERNVFVKKPGKYFMIALDDGHEDDQEDQEFEHLVKKRKLEINPDAMDVVQTKKPVLDTRVQELISLIFDTDMMKKQLQSMEVDIKKMPLGKINKRQIKDAYKVLNEIQEMLDEKEKSGKEVNKMKLKDCTNRFYTLIPHDFGKQDPPLISDGEAVRKKLSLMDALVDIDIANSVMKSASKDESGEDPIEKNYKALKTEIRPLPKDGELYKLLESYAKNSHDKNYFSTFDFEVLDIFEIEREGEGQRFESWKENKNRLLLWHGSRLTNWVGILSTGLRIAPPEAPKTGYRFGKGVYFADIISKSGSYCFTSNDNPHAVMLLAEVAIGKPNELTKDQYMEKAPPGTDSTKALGMAIPDPSQNSKIPEDVTVPCGKVKPSGLKTACSHNEYIVYDVSQIKIRYLLRLKFKHFSNW